MVKAYESLYTWSHFKSLERGDVLIHTDNSISIAIEWDGIVTALENTNRIQSSFANLASAFDEIGSEFPISIENHFIRDYSDTLPEEYYRYGEENIVRHRDFALQLRKEQAELISSRAMRNRIICVLTWEHKSKPWEAVIPKKTMKGVDKNGVRLIDLALMWMENLNGSALLNSKGFEEILWRLYHRDRSRDNAIPKPNDRMTLRSRVAEKPANKNGLIKVGDTWTKVLLLIDYPDAKVNWFYKIANLSGVEVHVTQVLKPVDVVRAMAGSASETKRSTESAIAVGGEDMEHKVKDHNSYRSFVSENNLKTYNNMYVIKLHHTDDVYLNDIARTVIKDLGESTITAPNLDEIIYIYWRISQMAQGHKTPFLRQDHTLQITNMAPVINFSSGDTTNKQMLRLTADAKAVCLSYPFGGTNHTFTAAKTGSGKGVETVSQICEMYPLGVNFYICEIGPSYKWTVEAFGGSYHHLNPETVISPLPDYALSDPGSETPLSSDIVAPTIGALLPLLGQGANDAIQHVKSVAEQIMLELYRGGEIEGQKAPLLPDFLICAQEAEKTFEGVKRDAARLIKDNLDSFLSGSSGRNFQNADTLDFSEGIVGVDFKGLMNDENLAKFILVFVALRFKQLAFANSTPARIILDELHEFVRIDRDLIKVLIQQLTRMGRKEAGAFHGISQEIRDADLEVGILNQITHRNFMFLQDGHEDASKLFKMNNNVLSRWASYRDPEAPGLTMDYRQCLKQYGESAYDLHLEFPQSILDLAHSSPSALEHKTRIGMTSEDQFKQLLLFRQAMA